MLKNYLKIAFRNLRKQPLYSAINILGLAVGIACCMLIAIYVQHEYSFDNFHTQKEQIFRLNKVVTPTAGGTEYHAITSGPMGPQLKADFPEVKGFVRILPWFDDVLLSKEQKSLKVDRFILADSTFFTVFDFELLDGKPVTALTRPLSAVISKEVAKHFFGDGNPIGQTITGLNDLDYTITGVIENAPENSHLQYDVLVSWSSTSPSALDMGWLSGWFPQAIYTYLLLDKAHNRAGLEVKLDGFMQQHFPQRAEQYELYLQPLTEIYLHSTSIRYDDSLKSGSITNVYIFSAVAILVLLIACINFMNLSTARSMDRAREVGVRKVLGASKRQLGWQFIGESLFLGMAAMFVSLGLIETGLPILEQVGIPVETMWITRTGLIITLIGVTIFTSLLSGLYPAFILSGFKPVRVLYGGKGKAQVGDAFLRKALVAIQFSLSIVLIIGTLVIYRQMQFISDKNLGFQKEQV
ncbi:MAG: ABC transporter permease, partial [Candidatus Halalkalibacterium sp. M3_1C_030]